MCPGVVMGSIMFGERTHPASPESQFAPQRDGLDARLRIQAGLDLMFSFQKIIT